MLQPQIKRRLQVRIIIMILIGKLTMLKGVWWPSSMMSPKSPRGHPSSNTVTLPPALAAHDSPLHLQHHIHGFSAFLHRLKPDQPGLVGKIRKSRCLNLGIELVVTVVVT
jgi:hypothetical protein